jgi:hypothetical protein
VFRTADPAYQLPTRLTEYPREQYLIVLRGLWPDQRFDPYSAFRWPRELIQFSSDVGIGIPRERRDLIGNLKPIPRFFDQGGFVQKGPFQFR